MSLMSCKYDHFSQALPFFAARIGYILNVGGCVTPATWFLRKKTSISEVWEFQKNSDPGSRHGR